MTFIIILLIRTIKYSGSLRVCGYCQLSLLKYNFKLHLDNALKEKGFAYQGLLQRKMVCMK